jgi:hypothetical protein
VNYGLLHGGGWRGSELSVEEQQRAVMQTADPTVATVGALAHALVRGHPEPVQVDLLKRFLKHWRPVLNKVLPRGMSYYLPTHLGGLGLPVVGKNHDKEGKEVDRFTRAQRVMASFLMHDPERQHKLSSLGTCLKTTECFSIWNESKPIFDEYTRGIPRSYTKLPSPEPAVLCEIRCAAQAEVLLSRSYLDPESVPDEVRSARYQAWRKSYEKLFDQCMRSTFPPSTDDQIFSDRPWREVIHIDRFATCEDPNERVDLRQPFALPPCAPLAERIWAA